jgi:ubiquinone/menaquinone biosynthesis C-methylase UbiE
MLISILEWILWVILLLIGLHTMVRIVRRIHKFPIPAMFTNLIDNPLRRRLQHPEETARRHGIKPGMKVLDIGPGNGTYTIAAARAVGESGSVVAVDIEPQIIERLRQRIMEESIANLETRVADAYELPFNDGSFDVINMVTVIGEIPDPVRAMKEFRRVLVSSGKLVFSELFMDPDYPRATTIQKWAEEADFKLGKRIGNWFYYTLIFEKA